MEPEKIESSRLNAELMTKHAVLLDLIGNRSFQYIDMPMYGNVGDLLIMQGTMEFFRKHNLKPRLISSFSPFDPDWIDKDDVVVFQGGGNFGDLYEGPHTLRERVAATKPGNRIIILPQSIHFSSPEKAAESAAIFRRHPDLHLCVRDRVSFKQARAFTDNVYLLPDMAHQLYPLYRGGYDKDGGALLIARVDDEKVEHGALPNVRVKTHTDWPQFVGERERTIDKFRFVLRNMARLELGRLGQTLVSPLWIRYANRLVDDAIAMFARHNLIITDRLHGHILAVLMDMPTIVLDNSYGKNSRYASVWTERSRLVTMLGQTGTGLKHAAVAHPETQPSI
jgi:pyruvyl transferase EpsO